MNHTYRLCWNRTLRAWVAASELAKSKGVGASRSRPASRRLPLLFSLLSISMGVSGLALAANAPTGGQVVGGAGQITQSGNVTTIKQNSQTLSLNWQSFDIGADQTVNFLQPGSSSIAVNRILGNTASEIYGHLNANGQVWLINPNGVLFGKNAQVNVGGIVASTLDLDASTLGTGDVTFSGTSKGSVINLGNITVTPGGYAALLGNTVSNQGVIRAQLGTVALAGGTAMTLTFADNHLMHLVVNANTVKSLVENRQLIVADGGQVLMTAGGRNSLIDSAVNNTGTVQAQTVQNHAGTITLLGGMDAGTVNVAGTLDASAPAGGNGGFIETSGAQAHIADGAVITTKAAGGKDGTWLVDPTDFTIAATGGDIKASTLETQLASGNVAFTSADGASGTAGNVNVNQAVTWSANTTLTLTASNNVNLNAAITNTGTGGKTVLNAGNAFVNNAGASGLGGNWAVYSVNPAANTLGGLTAGFVQYNATQASALQGVGNGLIYSVKPTLTVSGLTGSVSKSYDGSTSATLAASNLTDSGLINGDTISSAAGTYSQSNVGTGLTVTSPSSISGFTILNGSTPVYGYTLSGASRTASIGAINAAQLYASIIGDPSKVYDGTTTATLSSANYAITGLVTGQSVTVNQPSSVAYVSPNVNTSGGQVAVNATFASTNFVAGSGTQLSNYILPTTAVGNGIITPAPVQLSGVLTTNKTYDQGTADTLDTSHVSIFGVLGTDDVTLDKSGAVGIFASANAGNNIAVTLSGFTLVDNTDNASTAAIKVGNYQLIAPSSLTANITPYALTVSGISAADKVYDGSTSDGLNTSGAQLSAALTGDSVQLTGTGTGTFSQADAGTDLAVTVNGLTVNNSNYVVKAPTGLFANITPRVLDIEFSGSADKIYDSTDYATLSTSNFTVNNVVSGQTVSVNQAPALYSGADAPNVGADTVTATLQSSDLSFSNGAKAGNYTFNNSVVGSGNITPAPLTVTVDGNPTRSYTGTSDTSATLTSSNFMLSGVIPGETITVNGASTAHYYDTSSSSAPNAASYEGNAGVWGVVAALAGSNFTATGGTLLSNYALPTLALGYGTITKANVGVYLVTDVTGSKVYDGTTALTITPGSSTNYLVLGGLQGSDQATLSSNVIGNFASPNVGSQPLTVSNLLATDFTFTSGSSANYAFPETVTGTGTITPAPLTVSIIGNPTKTYNGNTAVLPLASSNFQITGLVSGQTATINPTASFTYATANAGTSGSDLISGFLTQNNYVAGSGTLLTNYTLDYAPTGYGTINQANLYVTGVYASNKVYDTNDDATVDIANGQLAGLADVDKKAAAITLTLGSTSQGSIAGNGTVSGASVDGTFASSHAGTGQAVTTAFSLGGTSANNYNLVIPSLAADITRAPLTLGGIAANDKVYDGNTSATFDVSSATLSGFVGTDVTNNVALSSSGASGSFSMANVGTGLSITDIHGFSLAAGTSGDKSGDYYVVQPTGLTANITPKQLVVSITGDPTKVYDGSTSATLTASDYTITGWVAGQGATLPQSETAGYASADVMGTNASTINSTLVSPDWKVDNTSTFLSNYILPTTATGLGTISPLVLNLSATRVYDTTNSIYSSLSGNVTNADNASAFGTLSGLNGDQFTVSGTGTTTSKNVGTYTSGASSFSLGSLALVAGGSANAGNYTLVGGTDTYTITRAPLNITGATVAPKVYNASTAATVNGATVTQGNVVGDVLGSDTVTVGNTGIAGTFASANANAGLTGTATTPTAVTINGADIAGTDAGNYVIVQPTGLAGTINQAPVTISGSRQYDSSATAGVATGTTWTVSGTVGSQTLKVGSGSGTVTSANVGTYTDAGSTFSVNSLTLGNGSNGGVASNYGIAAIGNQFQITPYLINLTGSSTYTGSSSVSVAAGNFLNGSNVVSASDGSFATGVNGETLTLDGPYTLANSGNAGTNTTTVNASSGAGLSLVAGSGSVSNYEIGTVKYTVNPYVLSFSGTRDYDGTKNVNGSDLLDATASSPTLGSATFTGLNGDTFTVGGTGSLSSADKGSNGGTASGVSGTPTGSTQIGVGGLTLTVASGGAGLSSNYTLVGGNDTYGINTKLVTITGERMYDALTDANGVSTGTSWSFTGVTSADQSNVTVSGTGSVSSANVGTYGYGSLTGGTFNYSGLSLAGTAASNYTLGTDNTFIINPYVIDLSGTRVYDGTTDAQASAFTSSGALTGIGSETINLSGTGQVGNKNVGTAKALTGLGSLALANGSNGGIASNYTLVGGTDTLTITPKHIDATVTAANKVYDATDTATISQFGITGAGGTGTGVVAGDTVGFSDTGATFSDANVANGKTVTVGGIAINGSDAGNYVLDNTTATTTANITPYVLDLTGTRVYDGSTDAAASLFGNGVLSGINGDTLTLSGSGTLSSKNVGTQQAFASDGLSGFTLTGNASALASNYTLTGGTDWVTITPLAITVAATGQDKTYDATTVAGVALGSTGVLAGDTVTFADGSATFSSPNAATGVAIAVTGINATGGDAGNYTFNTTASTSATINPYVLDLAGTREYDGTTNALASLFGNGGVLTGVNGQTVILSGTGMVGDKNVQADKRFTSLGSLTLSDGSNGGLAGNYTLQGGTDLLSITPTPTSSAYGISNGTLADLGSVVGPKELATPYGLAAQDTVGAFTDNKKRLHHPVERNVSRGDFISGLALKVVDGGLRVPVQALP